MLDRVPTPSEEPVLAEAEAYVRRTERRLARRPYYRASAKMVGGLGLTLATDGSPLEILGWAGVASMLTGMVQAGVAGYRTMVRYEDSFGSPKPHPENGIL